MKCREPFRGLSSLWFLIVSLISIYSCQKEGCEDREKIYYYLSSDEKKWLDFITKDTLAFDDSLGNVKICARTFIEDGFHANYTDYTGTKGAYYYNDSCPFNFKIQVSKPEGNFHFSISRGGYYEGSYVCGWAFSFPENTFPTPQDSMTIRGRTFYNLYEFADSSQSNNSTFYFSKTEGIIALVVDSILWAQIP